MKMKQMMLLGSALMVMPAPAAAQADRCDRACLEGFVDRYLAAMIAKDVEALPVSADVRFAENYQPLALGEGSWRTIDGLGHYRHIFADPASGQVGFIGTVIEHGAPAFIDLRLKIERNRIAEIEMFPIRDAGAYQRYEAMARPEPAWLETVPLARRVSREKLIAPVNQYFQSMQRNDGRGDYSFFHPECNRMEHALQTTNLKTKEAYGHSTDTDFRSMTCRQQWETGFLGFVTEIRDRRFLVVDEERQAVFAFATFDHDGTIRELMQTNGKPFVLPPFFDVPRTLQVNEAFKIRDGKLFRIEMTLTELPYGTPPPFADASDPAPAAARAAVVKAQGEPIQAPCDRACLTQLSGQFVQALIANDGSRLPLAEGFRYTENGQPLRIGGGLWGTLSAAAGQDPALVPAARDLDYRAMAIDPAGQIAAVIEIDENGTKGILVLRLKVEKGRIAEAEATVVREEFGGDRGGTVTLFQPRLLYTMDGARLGAADPLFAAPVAPMDAKVMIAAANGYFDALETGKAAGVPIAADCIRRDNGVGTTGDPAAPPLDRAMPGFKPFALSCAAQIDNGLYSHIGKVRERRFVADAAHGVLLSLEMIDTPGTVPSFVAPGAGTIAYPGPRSLPAGTGRQQFESELDAANLIAPSTADSATLFKFVDGKIARIDVFARAAPFGLRSGWAD